jgi:cell division protein FtsQ
MSADQIIMEKNRYTQSTDFSRANGGFSYTPISEGRPLRGGFENRYPRYDDRFFRYTKDEGYKRKGDPQGKGGSASKEKKKPKPKPQRNRSVGNTFFLFVILFLSIALVLEIVFNFIIAPKLKIRKIEMSMDQTLQLTEKQVFDLAGIHSQMYYYNTDVQMIRDNLEKYSPVKTAVVEKVFPDTLTIELSARKPVALSLVETTEGTVPVALDKEGVLFQIGSSVTNWDNPILSGVKFSEPKLGMKLPAKLTRFLEDIEKIRRSSPSVIEAISEFRFVKKNDIDFEVLMYPKQFEIPVRIGSDIDERLLKYIFMVLDVISRAEYGNQIEEIDCRTDQIVYRYKEGI